ncbi:MAG: phenylalanine--tRNA ligase subunit beta [Parcubacteria group bacterium]|nr:phenylalanine--tRNA ligase subunit beta [Parcubacteria group bacterium]
MKILYSWLKDYIALKESPEKLAEILSLYAFESRVVQRVGQDGVIDIELFPNRVGDAASHIGIARELTMVLRRPLKWQSPKLQEGRKRASEFVSVKVEASKVCPRYSARVVSGIKVGLSPLWLKKRLAACGLRSINNVVDVTNYVMLELGEPLHAFDWNKLSVTSSQLLVQGNRKPKTEDRRPIIVVRRAKKGEVIDALDAKPYTLTPEDVVIADSKGPLAIAGIKGGRRAEIDKKTQTIVLEAANFDPITIRKTSKRLGLRTDSSWRFENGLDPNLTSLALDRAAELIQSICGGEVARGIVDVYPKKVLPRPIVVDLRRLSALIGSHVTVKDIVMGLAPILYDIRFVKKNPHALILKVHTARQDLQYQEDIAEEVARVVGYQNLQSEYPVAPMGAPGRNEAWEFREILRNHLASLGFSEVYNHSFIDEFDARVLKFLTNWPPLMEVENPISRAVRYLRPDLFAGLMKNIRDNLRFYKEVHLFEVGKQYRWAGVNKPQEDWKLAGIIVRGGAQPKDLFFEAKGILESLCSGMGLDRDDYKFGESKQNMYFIPGQTSSVWFGGRELAKVGIVRSEIGSVYGVDVPVAYWRIDIDPLMHEVEEEHEYEPPHKYPDAIRDISMVVPIDTKVEEVQNVMHAVSPQYLEDIDLFDIYEGVGGSAEKKSFAFHLIFRSDIRTLTDEEVSREIKKIVGALEEFGAEIR